MERAADHPHLHARREPAPASNSVMTITRCRRSSSSRCRRNSAHCSARCFL